MIGDRDPVLAIRHRSIPARLRGWILVALSAAALSISWSLWVAPQNAVGCIDFSDHTGFCFPGSRSPWLAVGILAPLFAVSYLVLRTVSPRARLSLSALTRGGRAALRLALAWSIVSSIFGVALAIGFGIVSAADSSPADWIVPFMALAGAGTGFAFATILISAEYERPLTHIPVWRAAVWGGTAGLTLPAVWGAVNNPIARHEQHAFLVLTGATVILGALLGAATLKLARRSDAAPSSMA